MITLQVWAYECIFIAHPIRLSMLGFGSHLGYEASIVRWYDDLYIHPSDRIRHDVAFYHDMLSRLVFDHVRFKPYHLYLAWTKLPGE